MKRTEENNGYGHILKYTGVFGGAQGLCILIGIVRNKLVALLLGPRGMGLIALFNTTITFVSNTTNLGLSMSAVKEISESYASGDKDRLAHSISVLRAWGFLTAVLGTLICFLLSPFLSKFTFGWGNHTIHFMFLAPAVGLMAVTTCELAVLKGVRQLRHLALLSVYNVIGALLTTVPLYYFWGELAIVPSLCVMILIQMGVTVAVSYRLYPLCLSGMKQLLNEGLGMIRLGIAFVIAGILSSGADFLIRSYLNNYGSLEVVGLYNTGMMMMMTYVGIAFTAMETDYFPRLSAITNLGKELNLAVNQQIEVSLLIVSPMLMGLLVLLPVLLPLLYSSKFIPVLGMIQAMAIAFFLRAVKLPIAYLTLARGESKSYLLLESFYYILLVPLVAVGYEVGGLTGIGVSIAVLGLIDFGVIAFYAKYRYRFCLSRNVWKCILLQLPLLISVYVVILCVEGWKYWSFGALLTAAGLLLSVSIFYKRKGLSVNP